MTAEEKLDFLYELAWPCKDGRIVITFPDSRPYEVLWDRLRFYESLELHAARTNEDLP